MTDNKVEQQLLGKTISQRPNFRWEKWFGLIIIICFFGGFGAWAYFAPLESAAIAPGKVTIAGSRRTIQHLEGGIVQKIYVRDGSRVKKDQTLIKLEDTRSSASLQINRNEVFELSAIEARLLAEIHNKDRVTLSPRLLPFKDDKKMQAIMTSQRAIFRANKKAFDDNIDILKQRIEQLKEQIKGLRSQLQSNADQVKLIGIELSEIKILAAKRLVERSRLLALQREAASLKGQRGELIAQIATAQQKIGETQLQIISLTSTKRKEALAELRETQQKLAEMLEREKANVDIQNRTSIRAPISGTVVGLRIHTVGGVIKPGEPIMDIVPTNEMLIVEARVSPLDIDVVHAGLSAKVQLSALQTRTVPTLIGKVTHVSADSFQDEKTGDAYYKTTVEIDKKELEKLGNQELYPGMPAEVMIITNKLTPWEYFIDPIKRSFNRAFREQ